MSSAGGSLQRQVDPASALHARTSNLSAPTFDPLAFVEAAIGGLLGLVALSPQAKRRLGLSGASRRADGWPAWYLWLAGSNGAYELALMPPGDVEKRACAECTLRYFPHPDEDDFATFADVERNARTSALFDHTGTPAIAALADLDPSLFHIAVLSFTPSRHDSSIDLDFQSQNAWLETITRGGDCSIRRRVPGLALAAPLVDFLVCGRTYHGRRPPAGFALAREPGLAWQVSDTGARPTVDDALLYRLRVSGLPALSVPASMCAAGDDDELTFENAIVSHAGADIPARAEPFATDEWWRAARWTFYPVGAMCGCAAETASVVGRDSEPSAGRRR